jgi:hypothetical protein
VLKLLENIWERALFQSTEEKRTTFEISRKNEITKKTVTMTWLK